jgi:hypothetical protein
VELSPEVVGGLLVLAILVGIAGLVVGLVALNGQRRVRQAYHAFSMGSRDDVLTLLERHVTEVAGLRRDVAEQRRYAEELRELLKGAVSRVGTVRYDAFDDMGGRLSFSTAFLDERGDGVVVSAINGRTDTRIYAKPVAAGTSRHNLSQEETAAISRALSPGQPRDGMFSRPRRLPTADVDEPAADAS